MIEQAAHDGAGQPTVTRASFEQIYGILRQIEEVTDLERGEDRATFKFSDKDDDLITIVVSQLDEKRLVLRTGMIMPEDNTVATLVAVNAWNGEEFSHGTFSYTGGTTDKTFVVLESHLILSGGVTESNVRAWLENLIRHVNKWEKVIMEAWKGVPTDSALLKKRHALTQALGAFAEIALAAAAS